MQTGAQEQYYLPSENCRLVLGFLKEGNYMQTYNCFLKECIHLQEIQSLVKAGREYPATIMGMSLTAILDDYAKIKFRLQAHGGLPVSTAGPFGDMTTAMNQLNCVLSTLQRTVPLNQQPGWQTVNRFSQAARTRTALKQAQGLPSRHFSAQAQNVSFSHSPMRQLLPSGSAAAQSQHVTVSHSPMRLTQGAPPRHATSQTQHTVVRLSPAQVLSGVNVIDIDSTSSGSDSEVDVVSAGSPVTTTTTPTVSKQSSVAVSAVSTSGATLSGSRSTAAFPSMPVICADSPPVRSVDAGAVAAPVSASRNSTPSRRANSQGGDNVSRSSDRQSSGSRQISATSHPAGAASVPGVSPGDLPLPTRSAQGRATGSRGNSTPPCTASNTSAVASTSEQSAGSSFFATPLSQASSNRQGATACVVMPDSEESTSSQALEVDLSMDDASSFRPAGLQRRKKKPQRRSMEEEKLNKVINSSRFVKKLVDNINRSLYDSHKHGSQTPGCSHSKATPATSTTTVPTSQSAPSTSTAATNDSALDEILCRDHTEDTVNNIINMTRNDHILDDLFEIFNVDKEVYIEREFGKGKVSGAAESSDAAPAGPQDGLHTPPHTPGSPADSVYHTPVSSLRPSASASPAVGPPPHAHRNFSAVCVDIAGDRDDRGSSGSDGQSLPLSKEQGLVSSHLESGRNVHPRRLSLEQENGASVGVVFSAQDHKGKSHGSGSDRQSLPHGKEQGLGSSPQQSGQNVQTSETLALSEGTALPQRLSSEQEDGILSGKTPRPREHGASSQTQNMKSLSLERVLRRSDGGRDSRLNVTEVGESRSVQQNVVEAVSPSSGSDRSLPLEQSSPIGVPNNVQKDLDSAELQQCSDSTFVSPAAKDCASNSGRSVPNSKDKDGASPNDKDSSPLIKNCAPNDKKNVKNNTPTNEHGYCHTAQGDGRRRGECGPPDSYEDSMQSASVCSYPPTPQPDQSIPISPQKSRWGRLALAQAAEESASQVQFDGTRGGAVVIGDVSRTIPQPAHMDTMGSPGSESCASGQVSAFGSQASTSTSTWLRQDHAVSTQSPSSQLHSAASCLETPSSLPQSQVSASSMSPPTLLTRSGKSTAESSVQSLQPSSAELRLASSSQPSIRNSSPSMPQSQVSASSMSPPTLQTCSGKSTAESSVQSLQPSSAELRPALSSQPSIMNSSPSMPQSQVSASSMSPPTLQTCSGKSTAENVQSLQLSSAELRPSSSSQPSVIMTSSPTKCSQDYQQRSAAGTEPSLDVIMNSQSRSLFSPARFSAAASQESPAGSSVEGPEPSPSPARLKTRQSVSSPASQQASPLTLALSPSQSPATNQQMSSLKPALSHSKSPTTPQPASAAGSAVSVCETPCGEDVSQTASIFVRLKQALSASRLPRVAAAAAASQSSHHGRKVSRLSKRGSVRSASAGRRGRRIVEKKVAKLGAAPIGPEDGELSHPATLGCGTDTGSIHATHPGSTHATPLGSTHTTPPGSTHATPSGSDQITPTRLPQRHCTPPRSNRRTPSRGLSPRFNSYRTSFLSPIRSPYSPRSASSITSNFSPGRIRLLNEPIPEAVLEEITRNSDSCYSDAPSLSQPGTPGPSSQNLEGIGEGLPSSVQKRSSASYRPRCKSLRTPVSDMEDLTLGSCSQFSERSFRAVSVAAAKTKSGVSRQLTELSTPQPSTPQLSTPQLSLPPISSQSRESALPETESESSQIATSGERSEGGNPSQTHPMIQGSGRSNAGGLTLVDPSISSSSPADNTTTTNSSGMKHFRMVGLLETAQRSPAQGVPLDLSLHVQGQSGGGGGLINIGDMIQGASHPHPSSGVFSSSSSIRVDRDNAGTEVDGGSVALGEKGEEEEAACGGGGGVVVEEGETSTGDIFIGGELCEDAGRTNISLPMFSASVQQFLANQLETGALQVPLDLTSDLTLQRTPTSSPQKTAAATTTPKMRTPRKTPQKRSQIEKMSAQIGRFGSLSGGRVGRSPRKAVSYKASPRKSLISKGKVTPVKKSNPRKSAAAPTQGGVSKVRRSSAGAARETLAASKEVVARRQSLRSFRPFAPAVLQQGSCQNGADGKPQVVSGTKDAGLGTAPSSSKASEDDGPERSQAVGQKKNTPTVQVSGSTKTAVSRVRTVEKMESSEDDHISIHSCSESTLCGFDTNIDQSAADLPRKQLSPTASAIRTRSDSSGSGSDTEINQSAADVPCKQLSPSATPISPGRKQHYSEQETAERLSSGLRERQLLSPSQCDTDESFGSPRVTLTSRSASNLLSIQEESCSRSHSGSGKPEKEYSLPKSSLRVQVEGGSSQLVVTAADRTQDKPPTTTPVSGNLQNPKQPQKAGDNADSAAKKSQALVPFRSRPAPRKDLRLVMPGLSLPGRKRPVGRKNISKMASDPSASTSDSSSDSESSGCSSSVEEEVDNVCEPSRASSSLEEEVDVCELSDEDQASALGSLPSSQSQRKIQTIIAARRSASKLSSPSKSPSKSSGKKSIKLVSKYAMTSSGSKEKSGSPDGKVNKTKGAQLQSSAKYGDAGVSKASKGLLGAAVNAASKPHSRSPDGQADNRSPDKQAPSCFPGNQAPSRSPGNQAPCHSPGKQAKSRTPDKQAHGHSPAKQAKSRTPDKQAHKCSPGKQAPSHSPGKQAHRRSPGKQAHGHSPGKQAHGHSPGKQAKSRTPDKQAHRRSPGKQVHGHSPGKQAQGHSPGKQAKSRTPDKQAHRRSPGKQAHGHSPGKQAKSRTPDKQAHRRSPGKQVHGHSPGKQAKSRTPDKQAKSRTPDKQAHGHSPGKQAPSHSGKQAQGHSPGKQAHRRSPGKQAHSSTKTKALTTDTRSHRASPAESSEAVPPSVGSEGGLPRLAPGWGQQNQTFRFITVSHPPETGGIQKHGPYRRITPTMLSKNTSSYFELVRNRSGQNMFDIGPVPSPSFSAVMSPSLTASQSELSSGGHTPRAAVFSPPPSLQCQTAPSATTTTTTPGAADHSLPPQQQQLASSSKSSKPTATTVWNVSAGVDSSGDEGERRQTSPASVSSVASSTGLKPWAVSVQPEGSRSKARPVGSVQQSKGFSQSKTRPVSGQPKGSRFKTRLDKPLATSTPCPTGPVASSTSNANATAAAGRWSVHRVAPNASLTSAFKASSSCVGRGQQGEGQEVNESGNAQVKASSSCVGRGQQGEGQEVNESGEAEVAAGVDSFETEEAVLALLRLGHQQTTLEMQQQTTLQNQQETTLENQQETTLENPSETTLENQEVTTLENQGGSNIHSDVSTVKVFGEESPGVNERLTGDTGDRAGGRTGKGFREGRQGGKKTAVQERSTGDACVAEGGSKRGDERHRRQPPKKSSTGTRKAAEETFELPDLTSVPFPEESQHSLRGKRKRRQSPRKTPSKKCRTDNSSPPTKTKSTISATDRFTVAPISFHDNTNSIFNFKTPTKPKKNLPGRAGGENPPPGNQPLSMVFLGEVSASPSKPPTVAEEQEMFSVMHIKDGAAAPAMDGDDGGVSALCPWARSGTAIVSTFSSLLEELEADNPGGASSVGEEKEKTNRRELMCASPPGVLDSVRQARPAGVSLSPTKGGQPQTTLASSALSDEAVLQQPGTSSSSAAGQTADDGCTDLPPQGLRIAVLSPRKRGEQHQVALLHTQPPASRAQLKLQEDLLGMKQKRNRNRPRKGRQQTEQDGVKKKKPVHGKAGQKNAATGGVDTNVTVITQELFNTPDRFGIRTSILLPKPAVTAASSPQLMVPKSLQGDVNTNSPYIVMDQPCSWPNIPAGGGHSVVAGNALDQAMLSVMPELAAIGLPPQQPLVTGLPTMPLVATGSPVPPVVETVDSVSCRVAQRMDNDDDDMNTVLPAAHSKISPMKKKSRGGKAAASAMMTATPTGKASSARKERLKLRKPNVGVPRVLAIAAEGRPELMSPQPLVIDDAQRTSEAEASPAPRGKKPRNNIGTDRKPGKAKGNGRSRNSPKKTLAGQGSKKPRKTPATDAGYGSSRVDPSGPGSSSAVTAQDLFSAMMNPYVDQHVENEFEFPDASLSNHTLLTSMVPVSTLPSVSPSPRGATSPYVPARQSYSSTFDPTPELTAFSLQAASYSKPTTSKVSVASSSPKHGASQPQLANSTVTASSGSRHRGSSSLTAVAKAQTLEKYSLEDSLSMQPPGKPTGRRLARKRPRTDPPASSVSPSREQPDANPPVVHISRELSSAEPTATSVGSSGADPARAAASDRVASPFSGVVTAADGSTGLGQLTTADGGGVLLGMGGTSGQGSTSPSKQSKQAKRLRDINIDKFLLKKVHRKKNRKK